MADPIENKLVDRRVALRYVRKGRLDEKEYEKYLKSLPDLAEKAVPIESDLEAMDLPDDEPDEELEVVQAKPQQAPSPQATAQEPSPQPAQAAPSAQPPQAAPPPTSSEPQGT